MNAMKLCTVFLALVITVNFDLAHCRHHSDNFSSKTIRLWYKQIYDTLYDYQYMPQPDFTKCYKQNGKLFAQKLGDDVVDRKLIDEMRSIIVNSSAIANVSKVAEFSDYFNEIENTYHQVHQRISNGNHSEDQTKLLSTQKKQKIKDITDKMNHYVNDGTSSVANLVNTSQINQNFINLLTQNCTRHVKLCSSEEPGQKLIDVYGYLASMEVKMVALVIDDDFLHGIFYNSKDVISEFRKIINSSIRRTRIYVILRMEILKKSKFAPKLNSVTRTDESHVSSRNDKGKSLESRSSFVPHHKPKYSSIMDKNKTKKNKAVQATRKTLIQISKWKDDFLRQLRIINDRIDLIWCANTPSDRLQNSHENEFEISCEMKTLNKASKPTIIAEMWNVSKDVIKLLGTVIKPHITRDVYQYGDIFNFSKAAGYSEKYIFTDILQTYKTTIYLSNSWDGITRDHFEKLVNPHSNFENAPDIIPWKISDEIHTTMFQKRKNSSNWEDKWKENYCNRSSNPCSTQLLKTELNTIFVYLAVTEMKIFIINMFSNILRNLISFDAFTNSTASHELFNQTIQMKSNAFLKTKDYLNQTDEEYDMKWLECKPFSWKTDIKANYTLISDYYLKSGLLPAGILNFAVKSLGKSVSIKLGHEIGLYHVKIVISLPSITITMMGNKKKTEIYKDDSIKFLLPRKFFGYWIKWKGRELSVGRARNSTAVIKITDVDTSILSHFTISNADWILYDLPSSHQIDDNKSYRETCWVDHTVEVGSTNGIACRYPSDRRDGYKLGTPWNNKCHVPIGKSQLMPLNSNYEVLVGTLLPGNEVIGDIKTTGEPLYVCPSWNSSTNGDDFDRNYCRPRLIYNDPTEY